MRERQSLPSKHRCMRYARTQALFSARSSGTAASSFLRTTKRPRKTEASHIKPTPRARDYSQAVSDLNLRVRTVADRHSVRKSARSSSENCQRKQEADETVRWTKERRWKQSWTLQGLSKPISSAPMLRCDAPNLGIPDAKLNHRFCMTATFLLHRGIDAHARRNVPTFSHGINHMAVSKDHRKRSALRADLSIPGGLMAYSAASTLRGGDTAPEL